MTSAGKLEKGIAISQNRYHQGVPAITVILDGGWSKRSHKHSYNAKSGVGIIIHSENTGKIRYLLDLVYFFSNVLSTKLYGSGTLYHGRCKLHPN